MARSPISDLPGDGSEPLIASDKDALDRHPGAVHVLHADGAVRALWLNKLKARGEDPTGTEEMLIGPDSDVAGLRKLRSK